MHDHDLRRASPSCGSPGIRRRWRCGRRPTLTPPVGLPLGVGASEFWPAQTFALPPDWALLLYTDGLIEARDPPAAISSGSTACWSCSAPTATPCHAELPARLVERAEAYNGGPLLDDVAILLLVGP